MTTRAGTIGMMTGLVTTLMVAPLILLFLYDGQTRISADGLCWVIIGVIFAMILLGGFIAARWSGSISTWRCAVLGGVSGGLAGSILFCLLGAATSGSINFISTDALNAERIPFIIIQQTMAMFLFLFLGGLVFGMLGGLLARLHKPSGMDRFDLEAPQMALNTSITAVPACLLSVALTAAFFTQTSELPLILSLFLLLVSNFALTLVIPHETRQAIHRTGLNEVMMAAFVGIASAPVLILLVFLIRPQIFVNPLILTAIGICSGFSVLNYRSLVKLILPRRVELPSPQGDWQKVEARWFGSIAKSYGLRLFKLCIGCGLVMVLPVYVTVLSVLINIESELINFSFSQSTPIPPLKLFLHQALASMGLTILVVMVLTAMYLLYLNMGRFLNRRNSQ